MKTADTRLFGESFCAPVTGDGSIREQAMEREDRELSPFACRTAESRGRERAEEPCPIRTEFQRDRDRILHCQSFRRLMHKTQVFLAPEGDHYRTRLTHTLEVTQIARCMARALRLNEDLTEAIGLGHDLGHTPFGHAGEEAMRSCFDPSFAHYEQSRRVVERLENDGRGLNLTWEVRDGIANHTGEHRAATLEGLLVKYADRIAYINHDIDDAVRAGILSEDELPGDVIATLGDTHSRRINSMVNAVVSASRDRGEIKMQSDIEEATLLLRKFLFDRVYVNSEAKAEEAKSKDMLVMLFHYFEEHPERMPRQYVKSIADEGVQRCVCDYIAGMTDRYAGDLFRDLYIPRGWKPGTAGP